MAAVTLRKPNFVFSTVAADSLALLDVGTSASIVMTEFKSHIFESLEDLIAILLLHFSSHSWHV